MHERVEESEQYVDNHESHHSTEQLRGRLLDEASERVETREYVDIDHIGSHTAEFDPEEVVVPAATRASHAGDSPIITIYGHITLDSTPSGHHMPERGGGYEGELSAAWGKHLSGGVAVEKLRGSSQKARHRCKKITRT